ncbi:DNA-binding transcriptional MerR regulator [Stackebrandtia albiflava]|uniref:DNA-binding transcriptional MerR regulator n=1 Tax=Stackebrandtia albiflava TaxID=406432 RepID=A0A562VCZ2_9ACTN|nr:MerR family transcriptional regulator [Stackebrandtia albiflava]TWJ15725.1 DNA-binding transcriptional MerR regulator [Stackebrandtia albiflava]
MRIGEVAAASGATPRSLRHYEAAGLIESTRSANGYRDYPAATVNRVANIRYLLAAGLTLADVASFLPCLDGDVASAPPSSNGIEVARRRLAALDERIAAQVAVRERLAAALDAIAGPPPVTRAEDRVSVDDHQGVQWDGRPARLRRATSAARVSQ